jgi:hypothetical protein
LPLLIVKVRASLGFNSRVVVADHGVVDFWRCPAALTFLKLMMLKWQARSRGRVKYANHIQRTRSPRVPLVHHLHRHAPTISASECRANLDVNSIWSIPVLSMFLQSKLHMKDCTANINA